LDNRGALILALSGGTWIEQADPAQIERVVFSSTNGFSVHTTKMIKGASVAYRFRTETEEQLRAWAVAFARFGHRVEQSNTPQELAFYASPLRAAPSQQEQQPQLGAASGAAGAASLGGGRVAAAAPAAAPPPAAAPLTAATLFTPLPLPREPTTFYADPNLDSPLNSRLEALLVQEMLRAQMMVPPNTAPPPPPMPPPPMPMSPEQVRTAERLSAQEAQLELLQRQLLEQQQHVVERETELALQKVAFDTKLSAQEKAAAAAAAKTSRYEALNMLQRATAKIGTAAAVRRVTTVAAAEAAAREEATLAQIAASNESAAARIAASEEDAAARIAASEESAAEALEQVKTEAAAAVRRQRVQASFTSSIKNIGAKSRLARAAAELEAHKVAAAAELEALRAQLQEEAAKQLRKEKGKNAFVALAKKMGNDVKVARLEREATAEQDEHDAKLADMEDQLDAKHVELEEKEKVLKVQALAARFTKAVSAAKSESTSQAHAAELAAVATKQRNAYRLQSVVTHIGTAATMTKRQRKADNALAEQQALDSEEQSAEQSALKAQHAEAVRAATEANEQLRVQLHESEAAAEAAAVEHRNAEEIAALHQQEADAADEAERKLAGSVVDAKAAAARSAQHWRSAIQAKRALDSALLEVRQQHQDAIDSGVHESVEVEHEEIVLEHEDRAADAAAKEENAIANLVAAKRAVTSAAQKWTRSVAQKRELAATAEVADAERVEMQRAAVVTEAHAATCVEAHAVATAAVRRVEQRALVLAPFVVPPTDVEEAELPLGPPPAHLLALSGATKEVIAVGRAARTSPKARAQRRNFLSRARTLPFAPGVRVVVWKDENWVEGVILRMVDHASCEIKFDDRELTIVENLNHVTRIASHSVESTTATLCEHVVDWCDAGDLKKADAMLGAMQNSLHIAPSIMTYNAVVKEWCNRGEMTRAEALVQTMVQGGVAPDTVTYNCLILGWCTAGDMMRAESAYEEMLARDVVQSAVTLNAMVRGWAKQGSPDKSAVYVAIVDGSACALTARSYNALVNAHCALGSMDEAVETFNAMVAAGQYPNAGTLDALVNGCVAVGNTTQAAATIEDMHPWGVIATAENFCALVKGYCAERSMESAEHVIGQMKSVGVVPGTQVYNALMKGWSAARQTQRALNVMDRMDMVGVAPNLETMNLLVAIHSEAGRMGQAHGCVHDLCVGGGLSPNAMTYQLLLGGYCNVGDMVGANETIIAMKRVEGERVPSMRSSISRRSVTPKIIAGMLKNQAFLSAWFKSEEPRATLTLLLSNNVTPDHHTFHGLVLSLIVRCVVRFRGATLSASAARPRPAHPHPATPQPSSQKPPRGRAIVFRRHARNQRSARSTDVGSGFEQAPREASQEDMCEVRREASAGGVGDVQRRASAGLVPRQLAEFAAVASDAALSDQEVRVVDRSLARNPTTCST
jgi:pentatricopeptide repeat protein